MVRVLYHRVPWSGYYITGYHGPGVSGWISSFFTPHREPQPDDGPHIGPKYVVAVNSYNIITHIVVFDCKC